MNTSQPHNPIFLRLEKIGRLWEHFRNLPEARICRWVIHPDEKQMVEGFLETTYGEENPITDFFLPFYSDFIQIEGYAGQLIGELSATIEADREALEEEGIHITWKPEILQEDTKANFFLNNFNRFAEQAPGKELMVAVLMPPIINKQLGKWLVQAIEQGIPDNIRLLVLDIAGEEKLGEVGINFPIHIHTANLELDMPDAMRQLAAMGNPDNPGVKFRKAFLDLAQAASNKNLAAVNRLESIPLAIAQEQRWVSMEIAVHSLVASAYIGLNKLPQAEKRYDLAIELAKKAKEDGDKTANTLAVQSFLNKGSVCMELKKNYEAANAYEQAGIFAEEAGDFYQVMEAKRMQGSCLEKCGEWKQAFEVEKEALNAAAHLEENLRMNSTLPYLGQSLLELAYRFGDKNEYEALEEKINTLAGYNWQSKLPQTKAAAV